MFVAWLVGFLLLGSWVFVLGASAAPKPPRPVRPGAGYLRRYAGGGGQKCVEVFLQIFPFVHPGSFASRRLPAGQDGVIPVPTLGFAAACRIRGRQLRRASAMFSPRPPLYCRWCACRCEVLRITGCFIARGIAVGVILCCPSPQPPGKPKRLFNDAPNICP